MVADGDGIADLKEIEGNNGTDGPVVEKVETSTPKIDIAAKVKNAILKKKKKIQGVPSNAEKSSRILTNTAIKDGSGAGSKPRVSGIINKIEKTVASLADTNNTMETLNKNMGQFINLIKKRGSNSGSNSNSDFGDLSDSGEPEIKDDGGIGLGNLGDMNGSSKNASGNNFGGMLGNNALMSVLVGNMLKNKNKTELPFSDINRESHDYVKALTGRLQKYQKEYELLQYLFSKKKPMSNVPNLQEGSSGNSAWLVGFLSMMNK
ncbi:MAG: hypothetical protein ACTSWY_09205 [Promethearchaeota archaeon]